MIDDLVSLKAVALARGVRRAIEKRARLPDTFATDLPAIDVVILNILVPSQVTLGKCQPLIHVERLSPPQNAHKLLMIVPLLLHGNASWQVLLSSGKYSPFELPRRSWKPSIICHFKLRKATQPFPI